MPLYDHAFTIAFSLRSSCADGSSIPGAVLRRAIFTRLAGLSDHELIEAVGMPYDTYDVVSDRGA